MAVLQMELMSKALMRTVPVTVILPADKILLPWQKSREEKPFPTLYLLHGVFGSSTDWLYRTHIQALAEEHDLAVVMPSGENAFYLDHADMHNNYAEYIGEELVTLTRKMFPLSHERKETFIGGLSMGGYGALRNGLKYHETFGAIISLSGALHLEEISLRTKNEGIFIETRKYAEACFGDLSAILESDKNPSYMASKLQAAGKTIPKIYMACGESDSLLSANRKVAERLKASGAELSFETGPGGHEWSFWDRYIDRAISWLDIGQQGKGMNSGNIGVGDEKAQ